MWPGAEAALAMVSSLRRADGRTWGEVATQFQWDAVRAVLADEDVPYGFWTRPRGGSKTEDVAALSIAILLLQAPREARLYVLAADREQGALVIDSIRMFVANTEGLAQLLTVHNFRVSVVGGGASLEILAADSQGHPSKAVDLSEVEEWLASTARTYNDGLILLDQWGSAQMGQQLQRRGFRAEQVNATQASVSHLATTVHIHIRQHRLEIPDDDALVDEFARIELRETAPGLLRFHHRDGEHDDRAFAVGLAAVRLLEKPLQGPRGRLLVAPPTFARGLRSPFF